MPEERVESESETSQSSKKPYTTTREALKRDLLRLLGREKFEIAWLRTGPKTRVGRFARTEEPASCQQCGSDHRYFHLVSSSIPYPWIWSHNRLVCHTCHIENRGTGTPWTDADPKEVFGLHD